MAMTQPIMPLASYSAYRRHCAVQGYCDPFIPFVGDEYGAHEGVKFAYCGGAAWWAEKHDLIEDDAEALERGAKLTREFVADGMYNAPYWRLFWKIAGIVPGLAGQPDDVLLNRFAWTNISKTGVVGQSSPPNNDNHLRQLDIEQFNYEMNLLQPDLLVCVSGSLVPSTAYALFDNLKWQVVEDVRPLTASTWIRRSKNGGWLLWTMHPAYKPRAWFDSVLADVQVVLDAIAAERVNA